MIKPGVLSLHEDADVVGVVFDAPLVIKGWSWFPLAQFVTWLIMVREVGRRQPELNLVRRVKIGCLTMSAILGSEWCHNLAHAAAAKWVGKPVDAIRVNLGMPLLVYNDSEDSSVTPQQHIWRALGGPLINISLLAVSAYLKRFTKVGDPAWDTLDAARGANLTLLIASLMPQPWLDGGALLKWTLVGKGQTLEEADEAVRQANWAAAVGMGVASATAFKANKRRWGGFFGCMAALSLAVAAGLLREKV